MHPYLTGLMAEAHREDLLREAAQYRLVARALAARSTHTQTHWRTALAHLGAKARLLAKPAPAAVVGCSPQPVCCPT